ncbi:MAG TPA: hypothetical protein VHH53_05205 [Pseudonocardiaceae bacterium]|nr:hypothetical protein [Pseudonocardiaceae bacterium]
MLSGVRELAVGTALAIGLLIPLTAAFVVGTMVAAGVTAHRRNGFDSRKAMSTSSWSALSAQ